jgi:hypothetical protein
VLLVTDAETSTYPRTEELWAALDALRPLVFAVHVLGAGEPVRSRQLMQDWSAAGGGTYQYARTSGEVDRAFDRLASWLRRPPSYSLAYTTARSEEPPPQPGSIRVVGAGGITPETPLEIVFDTSGSMRQKLKGKRRIDIAKKVMADLVSKRIPAGAPVAMRIFDGSDGGCGTSLDVPLGPLDNAALAARIRGLRIEAEVNTPIASSLRAVADDLRGVKGPKAVVLVTDGEESCGGDPRAEIRRLASRGVGAQVNIVGFALGKNARIRRQMRGWARVGRGVYYEAQDAKQLARAVTRAVAAPFRVYDGAGTLVAGGTVNGDPVPRPWCDSRRSWSRKAESSSSTSPTRPEQTRPRLEAGCVPT